MKRILVLYGSRYGAAKQYAQWLSEDLNADCLVLIVVFHIQLVNTAPTATSVYYILHNFCIYKPVLIYLSDCTATFLRLGFILNKS